MTRTHRVYLGGEMLQPTEPNPPSLSLWARCPEALTAEMNSVGLKSWACNQSDFKHAQHSTLSFQRYFGSDACLHRAWGRIRARRFVPRRLRRFPVRSFND